MFVVEQLVLRSKNTYFSALTKALTCQHKICCIVEPNLCLSPKIVYVLFYFFYGFYFVAKFWFFVNFFLKCFFSPEYHHFCKISKSVKEGFFIKSSLWLIVHEWGHWPQKILKRAKGRSFPKHNAIIIFKWRFLLRMEKGFAKWTKTIDRRAFCK
jgi:hypothetical protein